MKNLIMNLLFMNNGLAPYGIPRNGLIAIFDPWRDTYGRNILPSGIDNLGSAYWTNDNCTITTGQTDVFGGTSAYLIDDTSNTVRQTYKAVFAIPINTAYMPVSLYFKQGTAGATRTALYATGGTTQHIGATINWTAKKTTLGTLTNVGNGWYRLVIPYTNNGGNSAITLTIYPPGYAGNGSTVGSCYVCYPALNIGTLYPYAPPSGLPQSSTDYTGKGNNAQLGSTSGSDTNDPSYNGVALVGDGVDDYAVVPFGSAAYRISVVDSGSGYTFVNEVPAYLNLFKTGASTYLGGKIGPTAYYNRVLTAGEIAQAKAGLKRYMAGKGVTRIVIAILSQEAYNAIKPIVLPSGVTIGTPITSVDGRCAICHGLTQEDVDYLVIKGATMYATLPSDFEVKQDEI